MEQLGEGLQLRDEEAWLQLVGNDGSRIKRSFGKGYRKSTTKVQRLAYLVSAFLIFSVSYIQLHVNHFLQLCITFLLQKNDRKCTRRVKPNDGPCKRRRTWTERNKRESFSMKEEKIGGGKCMDRENIWFAEKKKKKWKRTTCEDVKW